MVTTPKKETPLLAIPETYADKIITLYHSILFCRTPRCHKNVFNYWRQIHHTRIGTLLTIIYKGCHIYQMSRNDKPPVRQLQTRINLNDRPLSRLSMDLKVMPRSYKGYKFILCIIDEVTNYLITVPIQQSR